MATVSFSAADDLLYAYLAGEIDHDAAQSLRMQLDDALVSRSPRTLIIDLGGVGFMDSSGVGLILGRGRHIGALGGRLIDAQAKADLLAEYADKLGLSRAQTLAMGDGANDIPMLTAAGIGVAYHAKPKTEAAADVAVRFGGLDAVRKWFRP